MEITVVGAGVVGLSTALALEERGHRVRVIAAATGAATTSDVAGAVWFPYRAGPPDRVAAWAARTRVWLEQLAGSPDAREAGVDLLDGYEVDAASAAASPGDDPDRVGRPWWARDLEVSLAATPVTGAPTAWRFRAPRIEPARYLPFLNARLKARIEIHEVNRLADVPGDAVVNCTGLGARTLAADGALTPLFGQIAITAPHLADLGVTITDDRDPDALFYVIPRRDTLVLGGCALPRAELAPDDAITARILSGAAALGLRVGSVERVRTGLRPYRAEVRLERDPHDPRVIHCYGHGGAGFTLSRGCAESVAALLTI